MVTEKKFKNFGAGVSFEELFKHRDPGDLTWAVHILGRISKSASKQQALFEQVQRARQNGEKVTTGVRV